MTTGVTLFDVVIFGIDREGLEREAATREFAKLCGLHPDEAERLLQTHGALVKRQATGEEARRLQKALLQLGIRCNYRPATGTGQTLEILEEQEEDPPVVCPACGHNHHPTPGSPKPLLCEKCGVVFSKYESVSKAKQERAQVKRRLLERHQRFVEEQTATQQRREEEERRRQLEEEIRKELGLPKFVTSRRGVVSFLGSVDVS